MRYKQKRKAYENQFLREALLDQVAMTQYLGLTVLIHL